MNAYPGTYYRDVDATILSFARHIEPWDQGIMIVAVRNLIQECRTFPTVLDLREEYMEQGGDLPDPGRNMSPVVERTEPGSPGVAMPPEIRRRIRELERRYSGAATIEEHRG